MLAVPRRDISDMVRDRGFVPLPRGFADRLLSSAGFFPRQDLETDESRKQLIPYVVLRFRNQVFAYSRGLESSEKRLVAQWSIGLGGHIEWRDDSLFRDAAALYRDSARREVFEEVAVESEYGEQMVGLINDDSNDVGRVHLGIVHVWDLEVPNVKRRERKIRASRFLAPEDVRGIGLRRSNLETWSQLLIDPLGDGTVPPWKPVRPTA